MTHECATDTTSKIKHIREDVPSLPPRPPTTIPTPPDTNYITSISSTLSHPLPISPSPIIRIPSTKPNPMNTTTIPIDEQSDEEDDVLNEKLTEDEKVQAMEKASKIMSKYKNNLHNNAHPHSQDSWLVHTIKKLLKSPNKSIKPHKYRFENTRDAAKFNTKLLKRHKYDLEVALEKEDGTMLEPGSEFRAVEQIESLFQKHELWPKMQSIVDKGITYQLDSITEKERRADLKHMIARGNHKSASSPENITSLLKNYEKEVSYGWMLPVTLESTKKIKGAGVIPVGVAQQLTINDKGKRKTKYRTTHDASFAPPSNKSINDRMMRELLTECFYGHCLIRILHAIHIMRIHHPSTCIFITKLDIDAAYRRLHVLARMAVMAITIINKIAYILLRLPFGVANGPNDFSLISEPIIDLTNDILRDTTWDPSSTKAPVHTHFKPPH